MPDRKRGAQPHNLNALRHGFYSRAFASGEITDLDAQLAQGLQDEITMLRVVTRRVLTLADGATDLKTASDALSALGLASTRLAGLLRTQRILGGDGADTTRAIADAINAVVKELSL
jgi:hypothetical protein